MQGIFFNGQRLASKKALRAAIVNAPHKVRLEATSVFGDEYNGLISEAPAGRYVVVGPDPYFSRKWYATLTISATHNVTVG